MPDWLVTLLLGGAGVIISLIITFVFNGVINWPKHKKQKEQEFEDKIKAEFDTINSKLETFSESVHSELAIQQARDEECDKNIQALKDGLQVTVKNDLKTKYEYWLDEGYAPNDAKDDLEKMYQVYHNLGANGVMDSTRAKFINLPSKRAIKKAQKQQKQGKKGSDSDN